MMLLIVIDLRNFIMYVFVLSCVVGMVFVVVMLSLISGLVGVKLLVLMEE